MLPVFMEIAVHRNFLFDARCGAKDFFEKQKTPAVWRVFQSVEKVQPVLGFFI